MDMVESRWRMSQQPGTSPISGISQLISVSLEAWDEYSRKFDPVAQARMLQFANEGLRFNDLDCDGESIVYQDGGESEFDEDEGELDKEAEVDEKNEVDDNG